MFSYWLRNILTGEKKQILSNDILFIGDRIGELVVIM